MRPEYSHYRIFTGGCQQFCCNIPLVHVSYVCLAFVKMSNSSLDFHNKFMGKSGLGTFWL